jgi:hypothetical protein
MDNSRADNDLDKKKPEPFSRSGLFYSQNLNAKETSFTNHIKLARRVKPEAYECTLSGEG